MSMTVDEMWRAFVDRDARYDGRFVTAVRTTGVFCRPSCTCRKPRPQNVEYYPSAEAAARAGYRPCKRCRPDLAGGSAEAERRFVEQAIARMRARASDPLTLADLAADCGASPSAFARRFRAADGRSPMRALADVRAERALALLADPSCTVLQAALEAGFGSISSFARAFRRRTGMTPSAWRAARRRPASLGVAAPASAPGAGVLVGTNHGSPR
ncbi:MAG TPA: Ada metal-binding domain-containing protein [Thermodesulfobacteriota bacterium]